MEFLLLITASTVIEIVVTQANASGGPKLHAPTCHWPSSVTHRLVRAVGSSESSPLVLALAALTLRLLSFIDCSWVNT